MYDYNEIDFYESVSFMYVFFFNLKLYFKGFYLIIFNIFFKYVKIILFIF